MDHEHSPQKCPLQWFIIIPSYNWVVYIPEDSFHFHVRPRPKFNSSLQARSLVTRTQPSILWNQIITRCRGVTFSCLKKAGVRSQKEVEVANCTPMLMDCCSFFLNWLSFLIHTLKSRSGQIQKSFNTSRTCKSCVYRILAKMLPRLDTCQKNVQEQTISGAIKKSNHCN